MENMLLFGEKTKKKSKTNSYLDYTPKEMQKLLEKMEVGNGRNNIN